jgi:hypothetical protein
LTWQPGERIRKCLHHTAWALSELRRTDSTLELSEDLAVIWRSPEKGLGVKERAFMLAVAIKAVEPRDAVYLRDVLNDILDDHDPR